MVDHARRFEVEQGRGTSSGDHRRPPRTRSYKIQFQAPQNVGLFPWKVVVISDPFVGDEASRDVVLKIDDPAVLDAEDTNDDDISDPKEDSLASQIALMRGGSVKKRPDGEEEDDDDESSTDDDEGSLRCSGSRPSPT